MRFGSLFGHSCVPVGGHADQMLPDQAEELAWQYAGDGAALGAIHPNKLRGMFERQHALVSKKVWDQARAAGLDIPPQQDVLSYEDIEFGEDGVFMDYCQQCCPELFAVSTAWV